MKVTIDKKIIENFPNTVEYIVIATGLVVNTQYSKDVNKMLRGVEEEVRKVGSDLIHRPQYEEWLNTYQDIAKQAKFPAEQISEVVPAHVSLAKRVLSGKNLPNINPLVNFYNMFSLKYSVPMGGEDLSQYYGNATLRYADGTEISLLLGDKKIEPPLPGEIIWTDEHSVTCRMWGWRQSVRTKITNDTVDAIFYIDILEGETHTPEQFGMSQVREFTDGLRKLFGAKTMIYRLDKTSPSADIPYKTRKITEGRDVSADLQKFLQKKTGRKGIRKRKATNLNQESPHTLRNKLSDRIDQVLHATVLEDTDDAGQLRVKLNKVGNPKYGDFSSTIALESAGKLKRNPRDIANEIVEAINADPGLGKIFEKVETAPNNFINFTLSDEFIVESVRSANDTGEQFGKHKLGHGRRVLIEGPSWNPNKPAHAGHLLNLFITHALIRLFTNAGFEVINDNIDNDKGIPVMQTIWAYRKYGDGKTPETEGEKPDHFVGRYYAMGKAEYDKSEEVKEEVRALLRKWESGDPEVMDFWKKLTTWAVDGQKQTMRYFGEKMGFEWHESDVYKDGKKIVLDYYSKQDVSDGPKLIKKLNDGAYIAMLEEEYGLPDTVLIKSDGTGLYHTQDIYLTLLKKEKFDNPWMMIWVVGNEQITHFQRLFAILDAMGIMPIENLYHYPYGMILNKDGGKLASRDGAVMTADELAQLAKDKALKLLMSRQGDTNERDDDDYQKIAKAVSVGALKFAYLSHDPFKDIKLNIDAATSFTGKSGPYVMYAYTRARGILRNAGKQQIVGDKSQGGGDRLKLTAQDHALAVKLLQYPDTTLGALNNYSPLIIAEYVYELAKLFSNFYENVPVSKEANPQLKQFRLELLELFTHVLQSGMQILGIEALETM